MFMVAGSTFTAKNIGPRFEQRAVLNTEATGCGMNFDCQITTAILAGCDNFNLLLPGGKCKNFI
jgi:hypothetical protein